MGTVGCWLVSLALWGGEPAASPEKAKVVEVVFVLDTTGSMSGLIQAAKDKIWAIANTLANTKPSPVIKIGLVAYRDRGDAYVTKRFSLSTDLDAVYKELVALVADGGGDSPESVNQALAEAVNDFPWSEDAATYRVLFLVGDCPPHMDYVDDVKFPVTCEKAARKGIVINTIQCGGDSETQPIWRDIALKGEGKYFQVEQEGNAVVATTPYDEKLAVLSRQLDETCIYFGRLEDQRAGAARKEAAEEVAKSVSLPAAAQRAVFNASDAGQANFTGSNELIDQVERGVVRLKDVKEAELPQELRAMSVKDREAYVEKKQQTRVQLRQEISDLSTKRQEHLREVAKAKGEKSLDAVIFESIRDQAKKVGLSYDQGPSY